MVADADLENLAQPGAGDVNSQLAFGELPGDAMSVVFLLRDRGWDRSYGVVFLLRSTRGGDRSYGEKRNCDDYSVPFSRVHG